MSPRYATVNPAANAGLVEGMKGLFNPTDTISKQFKNGMMGTGVLGFDEINMSQSIKQHTTGSWGTSITVSSTVTTQGQSTLGISFTGSSKTGPLPFSITRLSRLQKLKPLLLLRATAVSEADFVCDRSLPFSRLVRKTEA